MSKVYGELDSDLGKTNRTRRGHSWIRSTVKTWEGSVRVQVTPDNRADITVDNMDVKINGMYMFRDKKKIEEYTIFELMDQIQKRFREDAGPRIRYPKKMMAEMKVAFETICVMNKLKGE